MKTEMFLFKVIYLLFSMTINSVATNSIASFKIQRDTGLTADVLFYESRQTRSEAECVGTCSFNSLCKAFFATKEQDEAIKTWKCHLLTAVPKDNQLTVGFGTYGVKNLPPEVGKGVTYTIRETERGREAVYNCTRINTNFSNVAIAYNKDQNLWPELSPECAQTLCDDPGIMGTLLKIKPKEDIGSTGVLYPTETTCKTVADSKQGEAHCHNGQWIHTGDTLGVTCVSSECYRLNRANKAFYSGTRSQSKNGITCQRWDTKSPVEHFLKPEWFVLDDKNLTKAQNFCRDPDEEGFPWCYQTSGERFTACDVPKCFW